jgi:hypothetical protein
MYRTDVPVTGLSVAVVVAATPSLPGWASFTAAGRDVPACGAQVAVDVSSN